MLLPPAPHCLISVHFRPHGQSGVHWDPSRTPAPPPRNGIEPLTLLVAKTNGRNRGVLNSSPGPSNLQLQREFKTIIIRLRWT